MRTAIGLVLVLIAHASVATAQSVATRFDYPVGPPYRTQARDGDGYYNSRDFGVARHLGEDWNGEGFGNTDLNDPVYSVANGRIAYANNAGPKWGNVIVLVHVLPDGAQVASMYAHLAVLLRTAGDVLRGEQIGTIGRGYQYADGHFDYQNTAHLHFELRTDITIGVGPGYKRISTGWTDPSDFIDSHRQIVQPPSNLPPTSGFTMSASGLAAANDGQTLSPTVPSWNVGVTVTLSAAGRSVDPDGQIAQWRWTVDGFTQQGAGETFNYLFDVGSHTVTLAVTDNVGATSATVQGTIEVSRASGPQTFPITQLTNNLPGVPIGISRDGSRIVFRLGSVNAAGGGQLWSVNSDGTNAIQISPSSLNVIDGYFGGTTVVFIACTAPCSWSNFGTPADVYVINPDGTGLAPLTDDGFGVTFYPFATISGDGTTVLYIRSFSSGSSAWFIANVNSGMVTELILPTYLVDLPSLNSDGSQLGLVYRISADGNNILGFLDIAQATIRDIFTVQGNFRAEIELSGDGQAMAFAGPLSFSGNSVLRVPTDGSPAQTLDSSTTHVLERVSINNDGSLVCYLRNGTPQNVFCANPIEGTTNVTNITGASNAGGSFLSSNGAVVVFTSNADLAPSQNADLSSEVFVALLRPSLSVDAAPVSTRSRGNTFTFTGFGFTQNGPVTRRVRQPNGTEAVLGAMNADSSGRLSWDFPSIPSTPTGVYEIWVIDDTTGKISNTVVEVVTP